MKVLILIYTDYSGENGGIDRYRSDLVLGVSQFNTLLALLIETQDRSQMRV